MVLFCCFSFGAVTLALFVGALVACMAADANAVALALATNVVIRGVGIRDIREHLEHAEPVVQVVKHGMDASDDRLSEFGKSVLEVLNETHCHWNHDVHDHVRWGVFAALMHPAPVDNALPVLVDFLALNLLNANDHFAMSLDVGQERQNGQSVFGTQCANDITLVSVALVSVALVSVALVSVALIKFTLDGKKVIAEEFGAAGHNAQRRCLDCLDGGCLGRCFHFVYKQQMNQETVEMNGWRG